MDLGACADGFGGGVVPSQHDLTVSGIDWCASTNKLVTCSHDRNAFVWTYDSSEGKWKPSIVILRIERAAISAVWSPDGACRCC